jgi:hypothetical protein
MLLSTTEFRSLSALTARVSYRSADPSISIYHAMCYRLALIITTQMVRSAIDGEVDSRTFNRFAQDFRPSGVISTIHLCLRSIYETNLTSPCILDVDSPSIEQDHLIVLSCVLVALRLAV